MNAAQQEELFNAALEIENISERNAMLDRTCAGNPEMRKRIDELLAAIESADGFFSDCVSEVSVAKLIPDAAKPEVPRAVYARELAGSQIGGYRIQQEIGEGGCGIVYLAEQERPVRRQVALKVIKLGMDTRSVIARFEAEQQVLALMDHPNIARVLDAGTTESGRPYFVMELVRGDKLTNYCDRNRLDIRQRLKLFIQVCQAIQHAHQKGIIHRDIKPSNILVTVHDGIPVPKVIDFGIAKAVEGRLTDQTMFTPYEHFIGTPAYMSPEQAELNGFDVDTRSDIYSLGVLLYELLTGKTPFDRKELTKSGWEEMRRTLRERDPLPPSARLNALAGDELSRIATDRKIDPSRLQSLLSGDLDWIVMKALEKDRCRRYETALSLASDVKNFLENQPVSASPPSRIYRLQKLVRRNRVLFAAGAMVITALVACSIVSTWLFLKEREARRLVEAAEQQKRTLQKEAVHLNRLRQAAEDQRRLAEALALANLGKHEEADQLVSQIGTHFATSDHEVMYRTLGDMHALNGRWQEAAERFAVLIQINHQNSMESTLDDTRYATTLVELGRLAEYERFRQSLVARYAGTDNPITAERIVKACLIRPANAGFMRALRRYVDVSEKSLQVGHEVDRSMASWRAYSLAVMRYREGNFRAALEWCERSQDLEPGLQSKIVSVQLVLALAYARLGDFDRARAEAIEPRRTIEETFQNGIQNLSRWEGFWFDWMFARNHLRELETVLSQTRPAGS